MRTNQPSPLFPLHRQVGNTAYMTRMHMWGPGTAFVDFEAFLDSMKKRWAGLGLRRCFILWAGPAAVLYPYRS